MRRSPFALAAATLVMAVGSSQVAATAVQAAEPATGPTHVAPVSPRDLETATAIGKGAASKEERVVGLEAAFAVRANRIASAGFDPFSSDDSLVATTLAASYWFSRTATLGLASGFEWSHGAASSNVRGTTSNLDVDGLALTLKASHPLTERLAAFVRLAPGAVRLEARLHESSAAPATGSRSPPTSSQTKWLPSLDVAAGAAFRLASLSERPLAFHLWVTAEAGYGYSPSYELALRGAETASAGRSDSAVHLGTLAVRGGFMRFGLTVTF